MDLEKHYEALKERIIDNFDYWLNDYIARDIIDVGKVDYLINEQDEYLFCLDLVSNLKYYVDEVLIIQDDELLIKFIELKKYLDNKIIKNKYFDQKDIDHIFKEDISFEIDNQNKHEIKHYSSIKLHNEIQLNKAEKEEILIPENRIKSFFIHHDIDKDKFIEKLYNLLQEYKFIESDLNSFKSIFLDDYRVAKKIEWKGTEIQITMFIATLIDNDFLDAEVNKFKYLLLGNYFLNRKGQEFTAKQLGSVYSRNKNAFPNDDSILKIINQL